MIALTESALISEQMTLLPVIPKIHKPRTYKKPRRQKDKTYADYLAEDKMHHARMIAKYGGFLPKKDMELPPDETILGFIDVDSEPLVG